MIIKYNNTPDTTNVKVKIVDLQTNYILVNNTAYQVYIKNIVYTADQQIEVNPSVNIQNEPISRLLVSI